MSNVVDIVVKSTNLTAKTFAEVNAGVESTSKGMSSLTKVAGVAALGFAAFGLESVKMASRFDSEMNLLNTQAGVSKDKIAGLKSGVLALAGKVGQDPDSLAESLFHVESNFASMGISSKKALELTKISAEGATVGQANLVDVTNALTAAVASGIPGVGDMNQAMGILNATVGSGDMKMQDLAKAFGTGMLATVKGFGLSITDVGAALATFGDNNIRGAQAGTQLRMVVQSLAQPVAGGADALKKLGLQTDTLAKDMQKGGLKLAMEDLVAHMKAAGISADQQGEIITQAFGKKAGTGINILVGQIDRLESKYPELNKGANNFSTAWANTTKTFAFQMKSMQTGLEALAIGVGEKLIPPIQALIGFLKDHKSASLAAAEGTLGLLAAVVAVGAAIKTAAAVKMVWGGITSGVALAKSAFETVALKAMYMRDASIAAGGGLKGLSAAFGTLSSGAKLGLAVAAIGATIVVLDKLANRGRRAPDVDLMATALGNLATKGVATGELTRTFGASLVGLADDLDKLAGKKDALDHLNDALNTIFTLGMKGSNAPKQATQDLNGLDKALAEMVSNGHADQANEALNKLYAQTGKQIPDKYLKTYAAALQDVKLNSELTADMQGRFGDQAAQVQQDLKAQQDVVDGLTQSIQALDQVTQGAFNADTQWESSISAATDAVKTNGKTLDIHTDKGRANRDALSGIAATTDDYTAKLLKNGASWNTVDAAYKRGRESLVKSAMQMGLTRKDAEKLSDTLLHVPKEVKISANNDDLKRKLSEDERLLKTARGSKKVKLEADISSIRKKIAAGQEQINELHGKTVTVGIAYKTLGSAGAGVHVPGGRYAHGGNVGATQTAATGGTRNGVVLVGEQGPELVHLPSGSHVMSNPDTRRAMGGGGGGGATVIEIRSGGSDLDNLLVEVLRRSIKRRTGGGSNSVQLALGV